MAELRAYGGSGAPLRPSFSSNDIRTKCPTCGCLQGSQTKIDDLENAVQILTQQSAEGANKLASYEEQIRHLRFAQRSQQGQGDGGTVTPHSHSASVDGSVNGASPPARGAQLTRFASFRMGSRKTPSQSNLLQGTGIGQGSDVSELQTALAKETAARQEAEKKVAQVNAELEDLSAQLFEQANEMVATERRARAKLEERVAVLEQRDRDKSRRLERIEGALKRLERVKALLGP